MFKFIAAGALALGTATSAHAANLITNGSFEQSTVRPGSGWIQLNAGNSSLPGWTIESGSIDLVGTYWTASHGTQSLDLAGDRPGVISQSFATVAGESYTITFDHAANAGYGGSRKAVDVFVNGVATSFMFNGEVSGVNQNWQTDTLTFIATGTTTKLAFGAGAGITGGAYGPSLDNVSVVGTAVAAVPEPASWAMMIAGFGLVGGTMRRRHSVLAAA